MPLLWMRHEVRPTERRAPIVPADAARLVEQGCPVTVEESPQRVFPIDDYAAAGCRIVPAGSWPDAPAEAFVIGIKELPEEPPALAHRHVYFGHAYKGQAGAERLLRRFVAGGGQLLDVEYLVDDGGRRLAAFGYWAGYVGAALAVLQFRGGLVAPLQPTTKEALDEALRRPGGAAAPTALVIGALGRSGRGARDALEVAGITATCWDLAETQALDKPALLRHDILVNTVLTTRPVPPFVTDADVRDPSRRLAVISDVSCDVHGECNVLPIYRNTTTWERPAEQLHPAPPLRIIAIDNLPSLLPMQASTAFSAELAPWLARLGTDDPAWLRCAEAFRAAVQRLVDPANP